MAQRPNASAVNGGLPDPAGVTDAEDDGDAAGSPPAGQRQRSADFAQSLERGLAVIRAFGPDHPRLTLSDVARRTDLTRATARRFLLTLVELGYVDFDGRLFWLRPQVLELGYSYLSGLTTPEVALPYMEDLANRVSASASLAVLDRDDIFYAAHVPASRMLAVRVPVGTRVPAHATALGHVLLAALPAEQRRQYLDTARLERLTPKTLTTRTELTAALDRVYRHGYALGDQGLEENLFAVAVPVTDGRGSVVAALGIATHGGAGPGSAADEPPQAAYLPALLETAEQVSAQLRRIYIPESNRSRP
jgi:IclR family transcriptional regulator, pca regulon regulatory protein